MDGQRHGHWSVQFPVAINGRDQLTEALLHLQNCSVTPYIEYFPTFLGKIVARNKNLLQGIIGFGRAILADTPRIKKG